MNHQEFRKQTITETEASQYIGMSIAYLRQSRCHGNRPNRTPAPPFIKIGRAVRYRTKDLDAWLEANLQTP